jgi:hypothetical protein
VQPGLLADHRAVRRGVDRRPGVDGGDRLAGWRVCARLRRGPQDRFGQLRILLRGAPRRGLHLAVETELRRREDVAAQLLPVHLDHPRRRAGGDLVEAALGGHHQRAVDAEQRERSRHRLQEAGIGDASSAGGVRPPGW